MSPGDDRNLASAFRHYESYRHTHREWAEGTLTIRDKSGMPVPYILQPAQIKFNEAVLRCRRDKRPVRIIVLKARQVMISTAVAAHFFQHSAFQRGQKALIVAHEEKAALNIFGYYDQFDKSYRKSEAFPYDKLERDRNAPLGGMIGYSGGGYIHVQTARNVQGGRSQSLRFLHLSEYAFYRDARALMTGLLQTVPDDPDTMAVKESTANGMGGPFYEDWLAACNGESDWVPLFFPWHQHPEYTRPVAEPARFQESLSKEELRLQTQYRLTLAQLHWRRWAIKNKCERSVDRYNQEYPSCPEEAFARSGRPRFSISHLARMPVIRDPLVGELSEQQSGPKTSLIFLPNEEGALRLYKKPTLGHEYVIGVDLSEGIDINAGTGGSADPDYSVAIVLDRDNGDQVASLRGRIEPGPFAEYAMALARWYNWAYVVPEANGPGIAFIEVLIREGYPPALIYRRQPLPTEQFASDNSNVYQMLGWKTSKVTREQLLNAHDMAIREFSILLRDVQTIAEHNSFVHGTRRAEAAQGCHDDTVIASALATIGLMQPLPDRRLLGLERARPDNMPRPTAMRKYGQRRTPEPGKLIRNFL